MSLALEIRNLGTSIANLRPDAPKLADDLHSLFLATRDTAGDDPVTSIGLKSLGRELLFAHEYARGGAPTGDALAGVARHIADARTSVAHLDHHVSTRPAAPSVTA